MGAGSAPAEGSVGRAGAAVGEAAVSAGAVAGVATAEDDVLEGAGLATDDDVLAVSLGAESRRIIEGGAAVDGPGGGATGAVAEASTGVGRVNGADSVAAGGFGLTESEDAGSGEAGASLSGRAVRRGESGAAIGANARASALGAATVSWGGGSSPGQVRTDAAVATSPVIGLAVSLGIVGASVPDRASEVGAPGGGDGGAARRGAERDGSRRFSS